MTGESKGEVLFMRTVPRLKGFWRPGMMTVSPKMNSWFAE
jgi:hypothetical protein